MTARAPEEAVRPLSAMERQGDVAIPLAGGGPSRFPPAFPCWLGVDRAGALVAVGAWE